MFNNIYAFFKFNKFKPSDSNSLRIWFLHNSRKFYVSEETVINTMLSRLWPVKIKTLNLKKIKTTFFFKTLILLVFLFIIFLIFLFIKIYLSIFIERNYILSNFKELRKLGDPYVINFDFIINSNFFNFLIYHRMNFFNFYYYVLNNLLKLHVYLIFFNSI